MNAGVSTKLLTRIMGAKRTWCSCSAMVMKGLRATDGWVLANVEDEGEEDMLDMFVSWSRSLEPITLCDTIVLP